MKRSHIDDVHSDREMIEVLVSVVNATEQCDQPTHTEGLIDSDMFVIIDERPVALKDLSDELMSQFLEEMFDGEEDTPAVDDVIPSFIEEEDSKTLLGLISQGSVRAVDFLKKTRSLSQAALNEALILACQFRFKYLVEELLQHGADIECRNPTSKTPVLICIEKDHLDLVRFLLDNRADLSALDGTGNNALILAVKFAWSPEMIQFLLDRVDINVNHQNNDGYTALMMAVEVVDIVTVNLLLSGYCVQPKDSFSCERDWALIDKTVNCRGETAQHIAEKCNIGKVFTLLKDCRYHCRSPLIAAMELYDLEVIHFLLDSEINTFSDIVQFIGLLREREEKEPGFANEKAVLFSKLHDCLDSLCRRSNPYLIPASVVSAAVESGDYRLVRVLCIHEAPIKKLRTNPNKYPLNIAAKYGRLDIIKLLVSYNAPVNAYSFFDSPLALALIYGHINCARFLINHGAHLDVQLVMSCTFLDENYQNECIRFILETQRNVYCLPRRYRCDGQYVG